MNIPQLLSSSEGKTLEFKRDLSSMKPILKTLVAFANTAGGTLIIGRKDDGQLQGVPNVLRAEERLASAIADGIRPAMTPEIEIYSHEGKSLLIGRLGVGRLGVKSFLLTNPVQDAGRGFGFEEREGLLIEKQFARPQLS